jgi:hypothetical protein
MEEVEEWMTMIPNDIMKFASSSVLRFSPLGSTVPSLPVPLPSTHIQTICPLSISLLAYTKYSYVCAPATLILLLTHTKSLTLHLSQLYPIPSVLRVFPPSLCMITQVVVFGLLRFPFLNHAIVSRAAVRTGRGTLAVVMRVLPWKK